jgi:hypothetical protein
MQGESRLRGYPLAIGGIRSLTPLQKPKDIYRLHYPLPAIRYAAPVMASFLLSASERPVFKP